MPKYFFGLTMFIDLYKYEETSSDSHSLVSTTRRNSTSTLVRRIRKRRERRREGRRERAVVQGTGLKSRLRIITTVLSSKQARATEK
jgi:hypothetical protein